MSCCGRQRAALAGGATTIANGPAPVPHSYAGVRAIAVKGAATGHIYRFSPGSTQRVHGADVPSMQHIPGLRPVDRGAES